MSIHSYPGHSPQRMHVPSWRVEDVDHDGNVPLPPIFDLTPTTRSEVHEAHEAKQAYLKDLMKGIVHLEGQWDADTAATNHVEAVTTARKLRATSPLGNSATKTVVLSPRKVFDIVIYKPKHASRSKN